MQRPGEGVVLGMASGFCGSSSCVADGENWKYTHLGNMGGCPRKTALIRLKQIRKSNLSGFLLFCLTIVLVKEGVPVRGKDQGCCFSWAKFKMSKTRCQVHKSRCQGRCAGWLWKFDYYRDDIGKPRPSLSSQICDVKSYGLVPAGTSKPHVG